MRERVVERLGEFVEAYQRPMAEAATIEILGLESREEATLGQARFVVRFDRVERRTDPAGGAALHILDYKTGGRASKARIRFEKLDPDDRSTWSEAIARSNWRCMPSCMPVARRGTRSGPGGARLPGTSRHESQDRGRIVRQEPRGTRRWTVDGEEGH